MKKTSPLSFSWKSAKKKLREKEGMQWNNCGKGQKIEMRVGEDNRSERETGWKYDKESKEGVRTVAVLMSVNAATKQ